jgi:hypothetical protein
VCLASLSYMDNETYARAHHGLPLDSVSCRRSAIFLQLHTISGDVSSSSSRSVLPKGSTHVLIAPRLHSFCSSNRKGKIPGYLRRTFRVLINVDIREYPAGIRSLIQSVLVRDNNEGLGTQGPEGLIASIHGENSTVARPSDSTHRTRFPSLALV